MNWIEFRERRIYIVVYFFLQDNLTVLTFIKQSNTCMPILSYLPTKGETIAFSIPTKIQ